MTQRTRPSTLHHLMAHVAGIPMSCKEFRRWKSSSPTSDSAGQARLRASLAKVPERGLTTEEARGLRLKRMAVAHHGRTQPPRNAQLHPTISPISVQEGRARLSGRYAPAGSENALEPYEQLDVSWYRRAVRRFERWAGRADEMKLDKGKPPSHIARMAVAVTNMTQVQP